MENLQSIVSIIRTVLKNRGKPEIDPISGSSRFREDIGFDSLDLAELTVRIEAEFDIDIFEGGIVSTVQEVLDKIRRAG